MNTSGNFLTKIGIPQKIVWGYLGILIFMMGDGLEIGWLSPWLVDHGFTVQQSSLLFTAYGVTVAIGAWFSGVLAEALGGKRTMLLGFLLYILGTVGFISFGISSMNLSIMLPTYALRGFGYPLFAYSFLVWISYRADKDHLGSAVGWFWFVFTGGLNVLGAYYSVWAIEQFGHVNTLWTSLFWVTLGAIIALIINKDTLPSNKGSSKEKLKEIGKGITIMKEEPKVLLGGIVRIINTTAQFAFPVFLPVYLAQHGIPTSQWLAIWGAIFTSNILFNLVFGIVGDKLGWRNTIMWFGGIGCGITTLGLAYIPLWTSGNIYLVGAIGIVWGACLAAYVPLSALVPSLVSKDKGAALAVLNLGAGLPVFIGPVIVGLFIGIIGDIGVIWVLAGLYFLSTVLTYFIKLPEEMAPGNGHVSEPS
ncbi:MFS transporter [Virgibacillus alimentarius]|uniref:Polyol permease family n=1 Tax=Virgibacillus alimentarius TaxID=698769 RepID=A0ABS4S9U1_9BACI|nr:MULTISPECIES: MFS transporter [Virgibacillus]MBP2257765.1 polyol permease family [Virgibacillus alimentarius]HLR68649.1 MFS transporter [Virgibacillus sp.]